MKKKLFGAFLAFVLVLSQSVVLFAAPSGATNVTTNGDTTITETGNFTDTVEDHGALSILELSNNTNASDAEIVNALNKTGDVNIGTANFVTKFYDVSVAKKNSNGLYYASLQVPALSANASVSNVRAIVFSISKNAWEVITPVSVDGKNVIFALSDSNAPLAVYLTDAATSPVTGVASNWELFMGAAVALFTVSAVVTKKKNN